VNGVVKAVDSFELTDTNKTDLEAKLDDYAGIKSYVDDVTKIPATARTSRVYLNDKSEPDFSVSFKKGTGNKVEGLSKFKVVNGVVKAVDSFELTDTNKTDLEAKLDDYAGIKAYVDDVTKIPATARTSRVYLNDKSEPDFSVSFKKGTGNKVEGLSKFKVVNGVVKAVDSFELTDTNKTDLEAKLDDYAGIKAYVDDVTKIPATARTSRVYLNDKSEPDFSVSFKKGTGNKVEGFVESSRS